MHLRGQYALEQMGVIALGLVIIAALFFFSMNAASDGARSAQAKDTAERIARAADSVYALGPGSKSTVSVNMPQGVQFIDTSNKRVWIRVALSSGNSDVFAKTSGQITGNIPATADLQDITLTVLSNGNISVGRQSLSCSPSSFTKTIVQGGSSSDTLTLFNSGAYAISSISASISGVSDMASGTPPASVSAGSSSNFSLSFSVPGSKPVGAYTGAISINGSNFTSCASSITIFVTSSSPADILGPVVSGILATPSNLTTITPATISATATDANNSIASCLLQLDSSGVWNAMDASDGSYSANMETIAYYIGYLDLGNHTVGIYCIDSLGNAGSQYSYTFSVSNATGGGGGDTQGPLVSNISITPSSPNATSQITVNATASDEGRGGSAISACQFAVDGFSWAGMNASDGAYGSVSENISASIGQLPAGNHTVGIRCNDSEGNWGDISSYAFSVASVPVPNEIAFIIITPSSWTTDELEWYYWLLTHSSGMGFSWELEITNGTAVKTDAINLSHYRAAILASSPSSDATLYSKLNAYEQSGHYIIMLGSGMNYALRYLGGAGSTATSASASVLYPRASHYITSGFTIGSSYTIQTVSNAQYYHASSSLTNLFSTSTSSRMVVGNKSTSTDRLLAFGITRPTALNTNGSLIATRAIDWALNASLPGGG